MILGVATRVCASAAPPGDESTPAGERDNNNNPTRDRTQYTFNSSAPTNEEGSPEPTISLKGCINNN